MHLVMIDHHRRRRLVARSMRRSAGERFSLNFWGAEQLRNMLGSHPTSDKSGRCVGTIATLWRSAASATRLWAWTLGARCCLPTPLPRDWLAEALSHPIGPNLMASRSAHGSGCSPLSWRVCAKRFR